MNESYENNPIEPGTPSSPKRKKIRAKYAPKACVSCRRSKLKCSGENPCQRCLDNGRRCFYSEDQTAAEALQHLSRPPPIPQNTQATDRPETHLLPRQSSVEDRGSTSATNLSMEARMARIEGLMEMMVQERGLASGNVRGSIESDKASSSREPQGANASAHLIDTPNTNPISTRQLFVTPHDSLFRRASLDSLQLPVQNVFSSQQKPAFLIRVGSRTLPFKTEAEYHVCIDFFFSDINTLFPCVNETEFRSRMGTASTRRFQEGDDLCFLALNYVMFACLETCASGLVRPGGVPNGWEWFKLADELLEKRKISGRADIDLIQALIYEAVYLTHIDMPDAAYNTIGLACRLGYQFALHRQPSLSSKCTPYSLHMRQRIFWTLYCMDRQIALSCGRPYTLRDSDIDVEHPAWIADRDLRPNEDLPEPDRFNSANIYLSSMIAWARLAGDIWDQVFAPGAASNSRTEAQNAAILDACIKLWVDSTLPSIPLLPTDRRPETRHLRQNMLIRTRLNHLRLLLRRHNLISLKFEASTGHLCGDLAVSIIRWVLDHNEHEAPEKPSPFRFYMATALGPAILTLSALLARISILGHGIKPMAYGRAFRGGVDLLHDLAKQNPVAARIANDLKDTIRTVSKVLDGTLNLLSDVHIDMEPLMAAIQARVPQNMEHLFPYRSLDVARQGENERRNDTVSPIVDENFDNTHLEGKGSLDSWEHALQPSGLRYGVPWL